MKLIAIFLLSVALYSVAESAPSDTGKQDAPVVTSNQTPKDQASHDVSPGASKTLQDVKKDDVSNPHGSDPQVNVPSNPPSVTPGPPGPPKSTTPSIILDIQSTNTTTTTSPTTPSTSTPTTPTTPTSTNTTTPKPTTPTTPPTPSPKPITTTPSPSSTTSKPTSSSTTTTSPIPRSTTAPKPAERHFDGPSFIGGAVLVLGLGAISGVLYMFYKSRTDQNYRTL